MNFFRTYLLLGFACTFLFVYCSDSSTSSMPDIDDPIDLSQPLERLPGDDNQPVEEATFDFSIPTDATDEEVSTIEVDGVEQSILLTEIEVTLINTATVSQVNTLLETYDAKIVDMLKGIRSIIIQIPDPGSFEQLDQIIDQMENESVVEFVIKGFVAETPKIGNDEAQKIPGHIKEQDRYLINHHLAIRGPAAWNMKKALIELNRRPKLVVADNFRSGPPGDGFSGIYRESDFRRSTFFPNDHGYEVLGIIMGNHQKVDRFSDEQNSVTGIFPEDLNIRAVDFPKFITVNKAMNHMIRMLKEVLNEDSNSKIILNSSIGSPPLVSNRRQAFNWVEKVRGSSPSGSLENKFIHFTAAGNTEKYNEKVPVENSSPWTYAALKNPTIGNKTIEKLSNIFVVENRRRGTPLRNVERPLPECAWKGSIMGGNLSAIGTGVYSFDANGAVVPSTGTSMASPQAAGVAAIVWSVNPTLSVDQVMQIIQVSSEVKPTNKFMGRDDPDCRNEIPQPVVDAYAAVLAAGGDNARKALLDVHEDGVFDEKDIEKYLSEFEAQDERILNYSRYDLNGTGRTGGNSTDRFDLNHSLSYGTVTQNIEGEDVEFDESSLTDQEILCYYAYSDLFSGDAGKRSELLNGICSVSLPSVSTSSVTNITSSSAQSGGNVTDDGGDSITARGVCWSTSVNPDLSDDCTTDGTGTGEFTSNLTGLNPETEYFIRAYASNDIGTAYGQQVEFKTDETADGDWPRDTETEVVEVTSLTGRIWMDRNLGASRAATSMDDEQAYGDLYQWGRAADGHQKRNSGITTSLSNSDQPGHSDFITSNSEANMDWRSPQNDSLWQGIEGVNNPCPTGFRLPTYAEWDTERQSWESNNAAGAFASPLRLPMAGVQDGSSDSLFSVGGAGYYWSDTVSDIATWIMFFFSNDVRMDNVGRANGVSVRCIKN